MIYRKHPRAPPFRLLCVRMCVCVRMELHKTCSRCEEFKVCVMFYGHAIFQTAPSDCCCKCAGVQLCTLCEFGWELKYCSNCTRIHYDCMRHYDRKDTTMCCDGWGIKCESCTLQTPLVLCPQQLRDFTAKWVESYKKASPSLKSMRRLERDIAGVPTLHGEDRSVCMRLMIDFFSTLHSPRRFEVIPSHILPVWEEFSKERRNYYTCEIRDIACIYAARICPIKPRVQRTPIPTLKEFAARAIVNQF